MLKIGYENLMEAVGRLGKLFIAWYGIPYFPPTQADSNQGQ